ncbi:hypothetical protein ACFWBF_30950 [Streptomyces sp. NPDC060028]|uniref:hypothetical protein n=1 Tax=Streptomyces sp. NPDC060028 TaxID=3347041 RepID=UPI0036AB8360
MSETQRDISVEPAAGDLVARSPGGTSGTGIESRDVWSWCPPMEITRTPQGPR